MQVQKLHSFYLYILYLYHFISSINCIPITLFSLIYQSLFKWALDILPQPSRPILCITKHFLTNPRISTFLACSLFPLFIFLYTKHLKKPISKSTYLASKSSPVTPLGDKYIVFYFLIALWASSSVDYVNLCLFYLFLPLKHSRIFLSSFLSCAFYFIM